MLLLVERFIEILREKNKIIFILIFVLFVMLHILIFFGMCFFLNRRRFYLEQN